MRIRKETVDKIWSLMRHLQLVNTSSIQKYRTDEEYRKHILIGRDLKDDHSAIEVYCNAEKLTAWHQKIWNKKKASIPHTGYIEYLDDAKIWRIGFRN